MSVLSNGDDKVSTGYELENDSARELTDVISKKLINAANNAFYGDEALAA